MADKSLQALTKSIQEIAEDTRKHIQPDVEKIRVAVCGGILESIRNINKTIESTFDTKKGTLAQIAAGKKNPLKADYNKKILKYTGSIESILNKILNKVEHINKSPKGRISLKENKDQKNKQLKGISKSIEVVERLHDLSLKDIMFSGIKIKAIKKIVGRFQSMFKKFKNQKEMEGTMSFANSSVDLVKKLAKMATFTKLAQLGTKAIEKIFLGGKKGGGILALFHHLYIHRKEIEQGKKSAKIILTACTSLFLSTILLTGIAVLAIPGFIGALAMRGIVWILSGTFKLLNKAKKNALIGSLVLLVMSASVITFALGLSFMIKAVKGMEWKDFGMMMASIGALGAVLAVMGIPVVAGLIALGSVALLLMGASLLVFGLGLKKTVDAVHGMEWKDLGKMMASIGAIGAATAGIGILSFLILPGALTLLTIGEALKSFAVGIMVWTKMKDIKPAITNIKHAIREVRKVMRGKFDKKAIKRIKLAGDALLALHNGLQGWDKIDGPTTAKNIANVMYALQDAFKVPMDKKAVKSYRRVGRVLKKLYKGLHLWENFDSTNAIKSVQHAIMQLKDLFEGNSIDKKAVLTYKRVGRILKKLYKGLHLWDKFDSTNAVASIDTAIKSLKTTFESTEIDKKGLKQVKRLYRMTRKASQILGYLMPWGVFKPKKALRHMQTAVQGLLSIFNMSKPQQVQTENAVTEKRGFWKRIGDSVKNIGQNISNAVQSMTENAQKGIHNNAMKRTMVTLAEIMEALNTVRIYMTPWLKFDITPGLTNVSATIDGLMSQITKMSNYESSMGGSLTNPILGKYFRKTSLNLMIGLYRLGRGLQKVRPLRRMVVPLKQTVEAVNDLDVSKASTMIELFRSFARIGYKPFDRFTMAVHEFSDSCNDLIDAMNNFNPLTGEENMSNVGNGVNSLNTSGGLSQNTEALAEAIAKAIKSIPVNVRTDISDVKLVVNGESGKRVILSLDN